MVTISPTLREIITAQIAFYAIIIVCLPFSEVDEVVY